MKTSLKTIVIFFAMTLTLALSACTITAERYKTPTLSAHTGGNKNWTPECNDGYFPEQDHRGVYWCVKGGYGSYEYTSPYANKITCEPGKTVVVERGVGGDRWYCADSSAVESEVARSQGLGGIEDHEDT